jgi:REP element-mobilizing transposase RayT
MPEVLEHHRRFLPHYQERDQIISLTWRLDGELPQQIKNSILEMQAIMAELKANPTGSVSNELHEEYSRKIMQYDEQLGKHPPTQIDLSAKKPAIIITTALHYYDTKLYDLHAYCVMPNHVHMLMKPKTDYPDHQVLLSDIVRRIKSYTAKEIIKTGFDGHKVWRDDYFDRFIRNEKDYSNTVEYILYNPVKAGLVEHYSEWPNSYFWKGLS